MTLGASVGHRFGHTIIFRPYYVLPQIPPIGPERKCDHPGNPDQVFGLAVVRRWCSPEAIHHLLIWADSLPSIQCAFIGRWAVFTTARIRISQIQPKRPFLLQHPPDFPEDLHQLAYVSLRALLQANLTIYTIVSQSESKEARSHSNQLTRSEVFLIPPARPPAEPGYSSINSPLMFILLCTNLWQPAQSKIKFVISSRRSFFSNGVI